MNIIDKWLNITQTFVLGPRCVLCRAPATLKRELCSACARELPWLYHACRHCALPLADGAHGECCPQCSRRPRFDRALAAFSYQQPAPWLITRLKFHGRLAHARLLGDLLAQRVAASDVDRPALIVPVPLHPASYRRRGFNQAERLARRVAHAVERPLDTRLVQRVRDTGRQSALAADQRAANVRDAFTCRPTAVVAHVAIVDDVVTTGQTAAAVATCLRRAGVRRVDLYCVARA